MMNVSVSASTQKGGSMLIIVGLVSCAITLVITLFAYGLYWPRQFQARVPRTNMSGVERAVGKPREVNTNTDGIVKWDYTHWWSGPARVYFATNGQFVRIFTEY
jgi:hypothetical protein